MSSGGNPGSILIVEDDAHINQIIADTLRKEGFVCTQAYSGTEGKLNAAQKRFDLIILDLMLPGLSGEELITDLNLELQSDTPVIVLSAKDKLDHKLNLFTLGAVDYVTKPFDVEELVARAYVHIGGSGGRALSQAEELAHKNLRLDCGDFSAQVKGHPLHLTRQEFKILELLLKHPSRVFTKQDLYELAWEDIYIGEDKTITVHISHIRSKLKQYDEEAYIDTVWGIGFKRSK